MTKERAHGSKIESAGELTDGELTESELTVVVGGRVHVRKSGEQPALAQLAHFAFDMGSRFVAAASMNQGVSWAGKRI